MREPSPTILIADDREEDVLLYRLALKKGGVTNPVQIVHDGLEAIDYLAGVGLFADRTKFPLPGVLLLDLKMPRMDGFDVLRWLHSNDGFCRLPVIVVSSSDLASDVNRAYDLGANAYLVKPSAFEDLIKTMQCVSEFWLDCACVPDLPTGGPPRPNNG